MTPRRLPIVWDRDLQRWCVMCRGVVIRSFPTLHAAEQWVSSRTEDET